MSYEQLQLFELTEAIVTTAKRIADGEVVNAEDKLDLAEQIYEARGRFKWDREYGNWWRTTEIEYSREWRAVLLRAGERIARDGRPTVNLVDSNRGEFSIRRYANTGDGWITGDAETTTETDHETDEWYTPKWLFDQLNITFDLDVCAPSDDSKRNVPANRYYTEHDNGLEQPWDGLVWCNPPYSDPAPWIRRWANHDTGLLLTHFSVASRRMPELWTAAHGIRLFAGMWFERPDGELQKPYWGIQLAARGRLATGALCRIDNEWASPAWEPI